MSYIEIPKKYASTDQSDIVKSFKVGFASTIPSGVDSRFFTTVFQSPDHGISQSGGNLLLTSGVTANAETIIRSNVSWNSPFVFRQQSTLSQRIANNNFYAELVDVIGDGLVMTINSATSVTVTIPNNPFDATNVGQSMYIGAMTVIGSVPGRYTIASVSGNDVTFTVAGFPASGTGTCSLFGWNYYQLVYNGTTATTMGFDTQRRGYASGFTSAAINTTATGHMTIVQGEMNTASLSDQLVASSTTVQASMRASRSINIPDESVSLYLQFRIANGTVAPASSTTWAIGTCSIERFSYQPVSLVNTKAQAYNTPLPVVVGNILTGTLNAVTFVSTVGAVTSANLGLQSSITDVASAALTTTTTTAALTPTFGIGYRVVIPVTAVTGTNPTLDVSIEESSDGGTNWFKVYDFPRITAAGIYQSSSLRILGNRLRYVQTVGGTTPSFTRSVNRLQNNYDASQNIQLISRTIELNTLNSTTVSIPCEMVSTWHIAIRATAQTTAATVALQFSDDGANWFTSSAAVTSVVGIASAKVTGELWRFARAIVTAAGSGITLDNVTIKGFGS
jgi:hypothetical protein